MTPDRESPTVATLRILQTTDLHMRLCAFDYLSDRMTTNQGLFGLAPQIARARDAVESSILIDCGDFLQGSPLADEIARHGDRPHPMIQAFNALNYDAITLGNHEFEYGLDYLRGVLDNCHVPVVLANVTKGPTRSFVPPWAMLHRTLSCADGTRRAVRIGVIGFAPPQITRWSADTLAGRIMTQDAVSAALTHLPQIRRAGADIVVALCHGGPSRDAGGDERENPALALGQLPGIDVVLMGPLHRSFPGPAFANLTGANCKTGTLHGTPAMMPGSHGSALGQMDLTLSVGGDGGWKIAGHEIALIQSDPDDDHRATSLARTLIPQLRKPHVATVRRLAKSVCDTPVRLTSYLAVIGHDDTADLLARVQTDAIRRALTDTDLAQLPLLASTSPFRAGGHGGPTNFIDIAAGPVRLRDCSAMAPFDNPVCAVLRRGWQVRQWLERSSAFFGCVIAGKRGQPLIAGHTAAYHFDTLHGLTYTLDLSAAPSDTPSPDSAQGRVRDVMLANAPLADDTLLIVATNAYRARGGGGLVTANDADIVHTTKNGLRHLLIDALTDGTLTPRAATPCWRFAPMGGTGVTFASNPRARDLMQSVAGLSATDDTPDGFTHFELTL